MANKIRAAQRRENTNYDENFIVVDAPYFGYDLLSCTYIVPKSSIKKESIYLFYKLMSLKPLYYQTSKDKDLLSLSIMGGEVKMSLNETYKDYLYRVDVKVPSSKNMPEAFDSEIKAASLIKKILKKSFSRSEKDMDLVKSLLLDEEKKNKEDDLKRIKRLSYLNINPNLYLKDDFILDDKVLLSSKKVDLDLAYKAIDEFNRILLFIGNTDYRPIIRYRGVMKPTSKIFPLDFSSCVIGDVKELKDKSTDKSNLALLSYKVEEVRSEQLYLLNRLFIGLLHNRNLFIYKSLIKEGLFIKSCDSYLRPGVILITVKSDDKDVTSKAYKIISDIKEEIKEQDLSLIKDELLASINKEETEDEIVSREVESRFLGLDLSKKTMASYLDKITLVDFTKFLSCFRLTGSMTLLGDNKNV